MTNTNATRKGATVVALPTSKVRRFGTDFPGWGHPDAASFLLEPVAGLRGVVQSVESHGSNPWTRYTVRWNDGSRSSGLAEGSDVRFA